MNVAMAWKLACSKDFSDCLPYTVPGSMSVLDFVHLYTRRISHERGGYAYTLDYYRESILADTTDMKCRLIAGYREGHAEVPTSIAGEMRRQVPKSMLGWSVLQGPKVLRRLFFVDMPVNVAEDDLVAAHFKVLAGVAQDLQVESSVLQAYVTDGNAVKLHRQKWAAETGTTVKAVKTLCAAVGYGSAAADWKLEHKVVELPVDILAIKQTLSVVGQRLWERASDDVRRVCSTRPRPQLTLLSLTAQVGERVMVDTIAKHLESCGQS
eukprot:2740212-Karenia_brevis.AAC.1